VRPAARRIGLSYGMEEEDAEEEPVIAEEISRGE
jgi:hypothetical protein